MTFAKSPSQLPCRMSCDLSLADCFLMIRFRLYILGENSTSDIILFLLCHIRRHKIAVRPVINDANFDLSTKRHLLPL